MDISIIVPVYNVKQYLNRCVDSIIHQNFRNIEIILVDDGSTDGSGELCDKIAEKDNRIKVIHQNNGGQNSARKAGIKIASSEYIGFVDSDDWIEPEMYDEMYNIITNNDCDMVSVGFYYEKSCQDVEICTDSYSEGIYRNLAEEIYPTMLYNSEIGHNGLQYNIWSKLFKKSKLLSIIDSINCNVFYGEDTLLLCKYCLICNSIYILKRPFYHYCYNPNSVCNKKSIRLINNTYELYSNLYPVFSESEYANILLGQLKQYILSLERNVLKQIYNIDLYAINEWDFEKYKKYYSNKLIIYGAGACGQALRRNIIKNGFNSSIVSWIDKYPDNHPEFITKLSTPDCLRYIEYDYIIIAIYSKKMALKIKRDLLIDYNIKQEKILWFKIKQKDFYHDLYS